MSLSSRSCDACGRVQGVCRVLEATCSRRCRPPRQRDGPETGAVRKNPPDTIMNQRAINQRRTDRSYSPPPRAPSYGSQRTHPRPRAHANVPNTPPQPRTAVVLESGDVGGRPPPQLRRRSSLRAHQCTPMRRCGLSGPIRFDLGSFRLGFAAPESC